MSEKNRSGRTAPEDKRCRLPVGDFILIAAVLLFAFSLYFIFLFTGEIGDTVNVIVDRELVSSYPLGVDATVNIDSIDGESFNLLIIEDGYARIEDAGCPDKVCVGYRAIRKVGEEIICRPNRLVIRIENGSK